MVTSMTGVPECFSRRATSGKFIVPTRSIFRRQLSRYPATSDSRVSAAIHSSCLASPRRRSSIPSSFGVIARSGRFSSNSGSSVASLAALDATHSPSQKIFYFAASSAAKDATELPLLLEKRPDLAMTPNDDGIELRLRGEAKHELWIAADTRESDVAVYLDSWRRKIERVGTMNFPDVARREKLSGTPVIEVTIGADGKLLQTIVRRSSGHVEIDEAAMRILKLAAPFDPFPSDLSSKHDQIRIAYEWQFLEGSSRGGAVFYSEPNKPLAIGHMSDAGYLTSQLVIAMPH